MCPDGITWFVQARSHTSAMCVTRTSRRMVTCRNTCVYIQERSHSVVTTVAESLQLHHKWAVTSIGTLFIVWYWQYHSWWPFGLCHCIILFNAWWGKRFSRLHTYFDLPWGPPSLVWNGYQGHFMRRSRGGRGAVPLFEEPRAWFGLCSHPLLFVVYYKMTLVFLPL